MLAGAKMKQRIFVGSSSEKLKIAQAIANDLSADHEPTVWNEGIFDLSKDILSGLLNRLDNSDAAIFVLAPDDLTRLRDANYETARDNVIFELGMFIGRLGRERTYFVVPRGNTSLRLPSDLLGLVAASYDPLRSDANWSAAVAPACYQIREALEKCVQSTKNRKDEESKVHSEGLAWMHDYVNQALRLLLTSDKVPSLAASGITASTDGFRTRMGRAHVCVRFGQIQTCEATEAGCVVALPANDLFDDECIEDPRSALGAYVEHAFSGRIDELRHLIAQKLVNERHELVEAGPKQVDRSYGIARCVYLSNPLGSGRKLILVSVTTKRAGIGVQSNAAYLFAAMKSICLAMNDYKLTDLSLPVMGSGHGGLECELALFHLLLSIKAVLDDRSAGSHLRSVSIVIFQKEGDSNPIIPRAVVGRILAVAKASL